MSKLRVLDLFSGIGGFSLGLERTGGFETVAFCEIEPFPRKVLAKHWPNVPCYEDVRTLTAERLAADGIAVDLICGGFPCQDISLSNNVWGEGLGLQGERSGLWREFARLIREIRPRFILLENSSALLGRGLGDILGELAEIGYDAEWHCIPASYVGLHHDRDRAWVVAYAACLGLQGVCLSPDSKQAIQGIDQGREVGGGVDDQDADRSARQLKSGMGGVAHGVPDRAHRLECLGNAVTPLIPEMIGHAIIKFGADA